MSARVALLACVLVACGGTRGAGARGRTGRGTGTGTNTKTGAETSTTTTTTRSKTAPTAAAVGGPVVGGGGGPRFRMVSQMGALDSQRVVGLGQRFSAGPDASVVVDLLNGARVHLEPSSQLYLLEFEPSALLLVAGSVFVELLPEGNQPGRTSLRLITALGSVLVSNTAELWVSQRNWPVSPATAPAAASQTYLVMLRGVAELVRFTADGSVQVEALAAGQTLPAALASRSPPAAATLDATRTAAHEFMRKRRNPALVRSSDGRFERAFAAFEQERAVGAALLARITPASAQATGVARVPDLVGDAAARREPGAASALIGSAAQVRAYQRQLASHAQRKHELRAALLLAAEQSLFALLAVCDLAPAPGSACPAWSSWQARYAAQLDGAL